MKFLKRINVFISKPKVFCIGMNKTGTTTMAKVFKNLNYRVAPQIKQEINIGDIRVKNNQKIIKKFCWKYNFFQDLTFLKVSIKQLIKFILRVSLF